MKDEDNPVADEAFLRGFHSIPAQDKLESMSFTELAELLTNSPAESVKFQVIERELKRHIARDQTKLNLRNIVIGAMMAGVFSLLGALVGAHIRSLPPSPAPAHQSTQTQHATP